MRRLLCASAVRQALVAIRRAMSAPMTGFEFGIAAPRPQIGLLDHVLGIVCRTEHPVAVREQLTAERLGVADELAHWCTIGVSVIFSGGLLVHHPVCR